jgi:hypothetical protein
MVQRSTFRWRASDSLPPAVAPVAAPKTQPPPPPKPAVAAQTAASAASPSKAAATSQPAPSAPARESPALKVLSGVIAGTVVALTKDETTLGRPGIQVASIVKTGGAFWLKPLEGASPPTVNGKPVGSDRVELEHGDVIEIAGNRVEFFNPRSAATQQNVAA